MNSSHFYDANHLVNLFANLQSLSFQDKFTDLRFVCANGETVNAHKLLFCSVSKKLKNMISDLPTGLDIIIINVPDIVRSKLSCIVEFMYTGVLKILPQEFIEYQEILTLLGIELNYQKPKTEGQSPYSQVYGQNYIMSQVNPVLNLPRQVISPSCFGLQQVQNQHTTFIPDSQPNTPIPSNGPFPLHMFTNQPAGVTPNNQTLSYPDVVNQNTKSSPNCVVINAEQAYKLIKQSSVQSVVQKIKNNPEVSLIPKSSTVSNIPDNQNMNHTNTENVVINVEEDGNSMHCVVSNILDNQNMNHTNTENVVINVEEDGNSMHCVVSNILENQNTNHTNTENVVIDVEEDGNSMHCVVENVFSLHGESIENLSKTVIDLEHSGGINSKNAIEAECITLDDEEEPVHVSQNGPNNLNTEHLNVVNNSLREPISSTVINKSVFRNVGNKTIGKPTSSTVINKSVNRHKNVNNSYGVPTSSASINKHVNRNTNVVNNSHGEPTSPNVINKRVNGNTNVVNNSHGEPTSSNVINKCVNGNTNVVNNSHGEPTLPNVINKCVNGNTNVVNNSHGEPTSSNVINKRVNGNTNVVNNSHGEPTSSSVINKCVNGNTNVVNNSHGEPTSSNVINKCVNGNTNVVNNSHGEPTSSSVINKCVNGNTNVVNNSHGEPTSSNVINKCVNGNTNVVNNSHGEPTSSTIINKTVNIRKRGRPKKNHLTDNKGNENNELTLKEKAPVTNSVKRKRSTNIGKKPSRKTPTSTSRKRKLKPTSPDVPMVEGDSKEMAADTTTLTTEANDKNVLADGQTLTESNIKSKPNQFISRGPCVKRRYTRPKKIVPKRPWPLKETY